MLFTCSLTLTYNIKGDLYDYNDKGEGEMRQEHNMIISIFDITKDKIVKYPLEEYILQILAFEIQGRFHIEVLKTYAIMIRTYILRKMKLFDGKGCNSHPQADICNDPGHCLGSIPLEDIPEERKELFQRVIRDTQNKVITFDGKLIFPYYHDTCGGATENSERVLGNSIQYSRRVLCDHCQSTSPHWQSFQEFSLEELEEKLNTHFPKYTPIYGVTINQILDEVERDVAGRILHIKVGDKAFSGREIQEKLGLDSTRFGWRPTGIQFFIQGKGHGVGLCKYGAQGLALKGASADKILEYYFTGVKIENMLKWSIKAPLKGKIILIDAGHGGKESGLEKNNILEKDRNLKISLALKDKLEKAGAKVSLTRKEDQYISLVERLKKSNTLQPHFMLSIHGNDTPNREHITEFYIYPGDRDAYELGKCVKKEFENIKMKSRDVVEADLYLARESKNSTIILDVGYFFIKVDAEIEKVSEAIYRGVLSYWGITNTQKMF